MVNLISEVKQSINQLTTCITVRLQTMPIATKLIVPGCMGFLEEAVILWLNVVT